MVLLLLLLGGGELLVEFAQAVEQLGVGLAVGAELALEFEALVRV